MPDFEIYQRGAHPGRRRGAPTVTVTRRGIFSFSPAAVEMLGSPRLITFLTERDERLIGFRAADDPGPQAYPLRRYGGGGHMASGTSVCKVMGADLSQSRRYPLETVDGVACIDLKQPGTVVTSNRAKRSP